MAEAHIEAQRRLRLLVSTAVERAWVGLPGYDEQNVDQFLSRAVPVVAAGRVQSSALTEGFLARALDRPPLGVASPPLRNGAPLEEVYRRPFVAVWSALSAGKLFDEAVAAGLARATGSAAMDVQLAMRGTATAVQEADERITGYQRVADGNACAFCLEVDGAFLKSADAMPLHNNCGCGIEPLTDSSDPSPVPDKVAVHEHGELGPLLADPTHDFTTI